MNFKGNPPSEKEGIQIFEIYLKCLNVNLLV